MVLEKTLESPLDCKEIKPVNPKRHKSWIFREGLMLELKRHYFTWCEELTHWKRAWCWERLKAGVEGDRGRDGWMASPTQWTWVWTTSEDGEGRGKPGVLQSNWTTTREDYSNYFGGGWWGWRFPGIGPLPTFWSLIVGFGTVMALLGVSFTLRMYYHEHMLRIKV